MYLKKPKCQQQKKIKKLSQILNNNLSSTNIKKNMTKIKQITTYLYICIGFFIITYIIYVRIFLKRIPKDLYINFSDDNCYIKIIFLVLSLFLCFFILITNIKLLYKISHKNTWLYSKLSSISILIDNSLKHAFSLIIGLFKNNYDLLSNFYHKFYTKIAKYPETFLLFIMYFIRLVIVFTFLSETLIIFHLNIFYKALILLCIVLLIKLLLFVMRDFASNVTEIKEALIIEEIGIDKETQLPIIDYSLKPEYEDNDLDYLIRQYILCNKLSGYLEAYDEYKNYFHPRVNIIIYSLYFVGWLYILYFNIVRYLYFLS
jgi:hypothetical protein